MSSAASTNNANANANTTDTGNAGNGKPRSLTKMLNLKIPLLRSRSRSGKQQLPGRSSSDGKSFFRRVSDRQLVRNIASHVIAELHQKQSNMYGCSATFVESSSSAFLVPFEDTQVDQVHVHPFKDELVVAPLHRKELEVGELLGSGGFSEVFSIQAVQLKNRYIKQERVSLSAAEKEARQTMQEDVTNSTSQDQADKDGGENQSLVVKHLKSELLDNPTRFYQAVLDLEQEANFLAAMNHPNIVKLRGVALGGAGSLRSGRHNEFFLVMDRLTDTLANRIDQWEELPTNNTSAPVRVPNIEAIVDYATQLASALGYLHQRRLIFRDVKADNAGFLPLSSSSLYPFDRLQLFDFGLCRQLPAQRNFNIDPEQTCYNMSMAGTMRYMSPEMLLGQGYNRKSDVYAWAMTVVEMISRKKPYENIDKVEQFLDTVCKQHERPCVSNYVLPPSLVVTLERAWSPSVITRATMMDVLDQLLEVIDQMGDWDVEEELEADIDSSITLARAA
ncbi:activated protein kinase kinase kinase [Seminavis robusta]|uniref:Activated protein kinase kinase kinase n=1 Tax=Seminavis robusta TaxID=568900 RepID=A0A9N8DL54_9STRA|nr:activated protein kinase kinase kinase [Seminavis robusta]|eukprot:Sro183_g079780.1 activated protein kinase kinase kinase (505) ;mRNA; r:93281-94795